MLLQQKLSSRSFIPRNIPLVSLSVCWLLQVHMAKITATPRAGWSLIAETRLLYTASAALSTAGGKPSVLLKCMCMFWNPVPPSALLQVSCGNQSFLLCCGLEVSPDELLVSACSCLQFLTLFTVPLPVVCQDASAASSGTQDLNSIVQSNFPQYQEGGKAKKQWDFLQKAWSSYSWNTQ